MAKQLNVNLAFTADTSQARAQMQSLQQQLTSLINQPVGLGQKLTADIQSATAAAAELKVHLQSATNVKTGTLDFGRLNQSLKASGTTLSQYAAKLQSLGPQGQQAFMSLARSVAQAEVPIRRSNALLSQMGTTLMNTARWQLSSSILHGFMGAVQKAYSYSKDLNESLNNIRIVTGYNIDQMSKFAGEANKAAKALSTTTTEYTNASLIYYQQGLSDAEVKARTDVTIKMANASRQSAEIVSDQMTSIWNNFYDGGKSLEYYADVVTALGAATASSSEEIATGLEKFAAVAETVGLSYEYATAALATVTATTRQSADIVGTAFKTLFARLSDLKLGETLEDGTTLGQYSENLAKIGVDIKDSSGALKDMDTILTETAEKWDKLDKAQQVALAKGVAGIRQYTQFIALMDNWDFMQENLNTASGAAGTLQKQADIYAESWEAASNRVQASLENIYEQIMDDEFFIDLTDGFAKLIDGVGGFIESIGGLQGVLAGLGMILTKVFSQQLAQGFSNLAYNITMSTKAGALAVQQAKAAEMQNFANSMHNYDTNTAYGATAKQVYTEELQMQSQLQLSAEKLTQEEQLKLQFMLDQTRAIGEQSIKLAEQLDAERLINEERKSQLQGEMLLAGQSSTAVTAKFASVEKDAQSINKINLALREMSSASDISQSSVKSLKTHLEALGMGQDEIDNLTTGLARLSGTQAAPILESISASVARVSASTAESIVELMGFNRETQGYTQARQRVEEYLNGLQRTLRLQNDLKVSTDNGTASAKNFGQSLAEAGQRGQQSMSQLFATMTSGLMSAGMLISSINGLMDVMNNPELSGWERFGQILTSVSMITLSLMGTFKGLQALIGVIKGLISGETVAKIANATATWAQAKAEQELNRQKGRSVGTTKKSTKNTIRDTWNKSAQTQYASRYEKVTISGGRRPDLARTMYKDKTTGRMITEDMYTKGYNNAGANAGKALGKTAAKFGMVAAAIAIVATTAALAAAQMNKYAKAAEDANTQASLLAEASAAAQERYNDFKTTVESYNKVTDSMRNMTKGTLEYSEALIEANEHAMKLIRTYKDLAGGYYIEDGLIKLDPAALEEVQKKELARMSKMQATSAAASLYATEAQSQNDKVEFARKKMRYGQDNGMIALNGVVTGGATAAATALMGAAIGSSVPVIGTIIGGIVGLLAGGIITAVNGVKTEAEMDALDKLTEYYNKNGNAAFADSGELERVLTQELKIEDDDIVKSLTKNTKATEELVRVQSALLDQQSTQWRASFALYNADNEVYQNFANQDYLNIRGQFSTDDNEKIVSDVQALWAGYNEDFWAAYLSEVMQDSNVTMGSGEVVGDQYRIADIAAFSDYVTLQKKGADGGWENVGEKKSVSESAAEAALIKVRQMEQAQEALPKIIKEYSELSAELVNAGVEQNSDFEKYILNTRAEGKKLDFSKFGFELETLDIDKIVDPNLKADMQTALNDFYASLPNAMKSEAFKEYYMALDEESKKLLWQIDIDKNYTLDQVKDVLEQAKILAKGEQLELNIKNTKDVLELFDDYEANEGKIKEFYESLETGIPWETFSKQSIAMQEKFFRAILSDNEEEIESWLNEVNTQNYDEYKENHQGEYEQDKAARETEAKELKGHNSRVTSAKNFNQFNTNMQQGGQTGGEWYDLIASVINGSKLVGDTATNEAANQYFRDVFEAWDEWGIAYRAIHGEDAVVPSIDEMYNDAAFQEMLKNRGLTYDDLAGQEWFKNYQNNTLTKVLDYDNSANEERYNMLSADLSYEDWYNEQQNKAEVLSLSLRRTKQFNIQERLGITNEEFSDYTQYLMDNNKALEDNKLKAEDVALANLRMNKGLNNLKTHMADYSEVLSDTSKKATPDYIKGLTAIRQDMADILDIDLSVLSDDFLTNAENLQLMQNAADGDAAAVERLREKAAQEIILGVKYDVDGIQEDEKAVLAAIQGLKAEDIEIGCKLNETQFGESLYQAAVAAGATVDDIRNMFEALGWEPEITLKRVPVDEAQTLAGDTTVDVIDPITGEITPVKGDMVANYATNGFVTIPSINGEATIYKGNATSTLNPKKSTGGGGSKKAKKKSDEIERYHEIQKTISALTRQYDYLSKAKNRAFGKDKIAYLDKEIEKTNQLIDAQEQYLAEIESNYSKDKNALINSGFNFTFDENGNISNYDEAMEWAMKHWKMDTDKYSDKDEEAYNEFKEKIKQYEETRELWDTEYQKLIDQRNQKMDQLLEKVELKVELEVSLADDDLTLIDYQLSQIEDDIYKTADAIGFLGSKIESTASKLAISKNAIAEILANHDVTLEEALANGEDLGLTQAEIDTLRKYRDEVISLTAELQGLRDQAIAIVTNAFDEFNAKMNKGIETMNHFATVMDTFKNIIDIVGKDALGISDSLLKDLTDASVDNSMNKLEASKAKMDALRKAEAEARAKLAEAETDEERKIWEDTLEHIEAETTAAEEEMLGTWEEALQAAADAFDSAVETTIAAFEKALSGTYGSLDEMQAVFDQMTEISERYVDDYKEIYELNKLNRDITKSIDETDNVKAKRLLRDLQEEIVELQESDVQMSEYDLDHLRKKYELRKAEIALEEAQNAKSQVRMRKDSEGNYGYVFTADADAIAEAQQSYEDKLYEMQELNSEYIKEMQNNILQSEIELANALRELDKAKFASDEEYYAEVNRLTEYYTGQRRYFLDEMDKGLANNQETVNGDWRNYSMATGYKMSADKDYIDNFNETIYAQLTGYSSIEDAQARFVQATETMVRDLRLAFTEWHRRVDQAMVAAGISTEEFASTVHNAVYGDGTEENPGIVNASEDAADSVSSIAEEMNTTFSQDALNALSTFAENYATNVQPMIDANATLIDQLNTLIEKQSEYATTSQLPNSPNSGDSGGGSNDGVGGKPSDYSGTLRQGASGDAVRNLQNALIALGYDCGPTGADGQFGKNTLAAVKAFQKDMGIAQDGVVGPDTKSKFKTKGYLTGGLVDYTGYAWLDGTPRKPEYVLNAAQTQGFLHLIGILENSILQDNLSMLASSDMINSISRIIDLNAGAQAYALGHLTSATAQNHNQVIEQEVTIHAEFPNATDHTEIEEAFNTLINQAAQFANRKN